VIKINLIKIRNIGIIILIVSVLGFAIIIEITNNIIYGIAFLVLFLIGVTINGFIIISNLENKE